MTHLRGKRSPSGEFKQKVRGYVFDNAYVDYIISETVCLTTKEQVEDFLKEDVKDTGLYKHWLKNVIRALVLKDKRGRGTLLFPDYEIDHRRASLYHPEMWNLLKIFSAPNLARGAFQK